MYHNINISFMFFPMILFLAFCSSTKGLVAPLIPPMSPESPFYTQVLKANNISITSNNNVTLNHDHYMEWLLSKTTVVSLNEESEVVTLDNVAGDHVMNLNIGDPIQHLYGIFDTGSHITWVQCTDRAGKSTYPIYNQTWSISYKTMECTDRMCVPEKLEGIKPCPIGQKLCEFDIRYGDGDTAKGVMAFDRITFEKPERKALLNFIVGCSSDNSNDIPGIIGASHSIYSLPQQLNPNDPKFSYCISSDYTQINHISFGDDASLQGQVFNLKLNAFTNFYYVEVIGIKVNGNNINVPRSKFKMSTYGDQGFIIDSGTSITILAAEIFDVLKARIAHFHGPPIKHRYLEVCYHKSEFWTRKRPVIALEFYPYQVFQFEEKRVWNMAPRSDKFECLMMLRTTSKMSILGVDNLLNVNVGYDPNNRRLYLDKKESCPSP